MQIGVYKYRLQETESGQQHPRVTVPNFSLTADRPVVRSCCTIKLSAVGASVNFSPTYLTAHLSRAVRPYPCRYTNSRTSKITNPDTDTPLYEAGGRRPQTQSMIC
jgi:hypothetical protein